MDVIESFSENSSHRDLEGNVYKVFRDELLPGDGRNSCVGTCCFFPHDDEYSPGCRKPAGFPDCVQATDEHVFGFFKVK